MFLPFYLDHFIWGSFFLKPTSHVIPAACHALTLLCPSVDLDLFLLTGRKQALDYLKKNGASAEDIRRMESGCKIVWNDQDPTLPTGLVQATGWLWYSQSKNLTIDKASLNSDPYFLPWIGSEPFRKIYYSFLFRLEDPLFGDQHPDGQGADAVVPQPRGQDVPGQEERTWGDLQQRGVH